MIKKRVKNLYDNLADKGNIESIKREIDIAKLNTGKILGELNLLFKTEAILQNIQNAEFQVFSQWGDDGIIHFLVNYLDITEDQKQFIEFGIENYTECNTRFLLINNNWRGLVMDGSDDNIDYVKKEGIYWRNDLLAIAEFITAENINEICINNKFEGEIGLLHIDIDGNDYWVWKAINAVNPIIVIVEYNSLFGFEKPYTVPYKPDFTRSEYHYSNLIYGTSLLSICDLAEEKGYYFIGCNSAGNNAYFIRKDKIKKLKTKTPEEGYVMSRFKESRDKNGEFTFINGKERVKEILGAKIYNTRNQSVENIDL